MLGPALVLAQAIAVVANPAFRPTPVMLANVHYTVAVDGELGGLVVRDLTVPPVTFAGSIRVEGFDPTAPGPEPRAFDDSVHFEPDGRVRLLVADQRGRPPIEVRVEGGASAAGGRITITAPGLPLTRVLAVTVQPFDVHEYVWRGAGHGRRDRLRVDDRRGMAFLTDSAAGGLAVALGFGPDTRGRIRSEVATITVTRRYGQDVAEERVQVGALTLFLEPQRDASGISRAVLVFGLGAGEEAAARAASDAAASLQGGSPAPRLRVGTPEPAVATVLAHGLVAAGPVLAAELLPASLTQPYARGPEGARAAAAALQLGAGRAVCADYARFRRIADASGALPLATGTRLGPRGPYLWVQDDDSVGAESRESAQVLKGYACYRATRDSAWLRDELPALRAAARGAGRRGHDPMRPDAFLRLAELEEEAARLAGTAPPASADSLRDLARRMGGTEEPAGPGAAAAAWRSLADDARRLLNSRYGRIGLAETGDILARLVRGLFGLDERLDAIVIAPRLDGAFDDYRWRLDGWRVWDDTLSLDYRPASREATIRLGAPRPRRLVLRFPWLTPEACLTVRRRFELERPMLVFAADGTAHVDIRGRLIPAEIRVSASCPP